MIFRISDKIYDSDRVPILVYWKTNNERDKFINTVINIKSFSRFTPLNDFTFIKVEDGVIDNKINVSIQFIDREEKSWFLRHLYELGSDCNIYVACPDDIPYEVITPWIKNSLADFGLDKNNIIVTT